MKNEKTEDVQTLTPETEVQETVSVGSEQISEAAVQENETVQSDLISEEDAQGTMAAEPEQMPEAAVKKKGISKSKPYNPKNGFEVLSRYRGAVMGISALLIWFFHEWNKIFDGALHVGTFDIETYIKSIGFCGVDIFFFLSGMGLTFAIAKGGVLDFYYRRIKRVYLPFLIVAIIRMLTEHWDMQGFWKNILCVNFYTLSIYSFLWFVPAILTLYLVFPLYYKIFNKASNKELFTGAIFILWLVYALYNRETVRNDLYGFINRIPVFAFGVYAGWATKNKKVEFTKTTWFFIFVSFISGLYFAYLANFKAVEFIVPVSNCSIPNLLIGYSFPFVLSKGLDILCTHGSTKTLGKVIAKVLGFFGLFSLEFYCVQEWLGGLIYKHFEYMTADYKPHILNLCNFGASLAAGFALYLAVKYFWKLTDWIVEAISKKIKARVSAEAE